MNAQDAIADFLSFMDSAGVKPVEPIGARLASGALIRFRCDGDGKGRQNGWAILYLDERPAGAFGNYRLNTGTLKWKADADRAPLPPAERDRLRREWQAARDKRETERLNNERQAALAAADIWQRASQASAEHSYIKRKRIDPSPLRQSGAEVYVPMLDQWGLLWNLQRIYPDGNKRFLKGGRIDDLFTIIGGFSSDIGEAIICEGYATGDSLHQAVGLPVIVTFSTANMARVARIWAERRADLTFTIFADDDAATAIKNEHRTGVYSNPGIETAEAVASEIGANIAYPLGKPQGRAA